jgi:transcriptional regulator with XRE-family HTH domain
MAQLKNERLLLRIALVLKELRTHHGLRQEEVYKETNIHIGRIEACKSNVTVTTLFELLKYFRINMSEFFEMVERREKKEADDV